MQRSIGQKLGGAFVVGGLIAVVAQAIMVVLRMVLPVKDLVAPAMLLVLGVLGIVLVLAGAYEKLNEIGGFGAGIMFCGLVDAVSGIFMGGAMGAGGKASEGVKAAVKFALGVLGTIVVVGLALGLAFAKTPGVQASLAPVANDPGMMVFLYAFLMGGAISIIGQLLLEFTPLPLPAIILLNAAAGMAMAVFGVSTQLEVLTGGGLCATVVDAGAGAVIGGALISLAGNPMPAVILVLVMVTVVIMGICTGNVLLKRATAHRG